MSQSIQKQVRKKLEDNVILISGISDKHENKPLNVYLKSVEMAFKNNNKVYILARGKATSRAIDLAEYCKRLINIKISNIETSTTSLESEFKSFNLSEIKIELIK